MIMTLRVVQGIFWLDKVKGLEGTNPGFNLKTGSGKKDKEEETRRLVLAAKRLEWKICRIHEETRILNVKKVTTQTVAFCFRPIYAIFSS